MRISVCCFFFLLLLANCSKNKKCTDYVLENNEVISAFPRSYEISSGEFVDVGMMGILSFRIIDTLLLVSSSDLGGFRTIISLPNKINYGSYLKVGNGPQEFINRISLNESAFFVANDNLYEILYDGQRGKLYHFDITETIRRQAMRLTLVADSLPCRVFNFLPIDTDFYFFRSIGQKSPKPYRFFWRSGERYENRDLKILNSSGIHDIQGLGNHAPLLSSSFQISLNKEKLIECPRYFGLINILPVDTTLHGKTLRLQRQLKTFKELEAISKRDRIRYTSVLRAYPSYFAVLWIEESDGSYHSSEGKNYEILFFDWNGNPLVELKLDRRFISFDIDFSNSELYILDTKDEFYKYDISNILSEL